MSKARVAPLKPITIPQLEFQAAVISSQISNLLKNEVGLDVTETFWTDSQVVLGYIKNITKKVSCVRNKQNPASERQQ